MTNKTLREFLEKKQFGIWDTNDKHKSIDQLFFEKLQELVRFGWSIADVCFASNLSRYKVKKFMKGGKLNYHDLYSLELFFRRSKNNGEKWLEKVQIMRSQSDK